MAGPDDAPSAARPGLPVMDVPVAAVDTPPLDYYRPMMTGVPEYPNIGLRLAAAVIDLVVLTILLDLLFVLAIVCGALVSPRVQDNPDAIAGVLWWAGFIFYVPWMESRDRQGTFGKDLMEIKVTDLAGNRISLGRSILRTVLKFLAFPLWIVDVVVLLLPGKKQSIHDLLAGTVVRYK